MLITDIEKLRLPSIDFDLTKPEDISYLVSTYSYLISLFNSMDAYGLSAIQVGIARKLFIVDMVGVYGGCPQTYGQGPIIGFINCSYKPLENSSTMYVQEGCLSFPGKSFKVPRHTSISMKGYIIDINGHIRTIEGEYGGNDLPMVALLQHEIDHQDGKLICDCEEINDKI